MDSPRVGLADGAAGRAAAALPGGGSAGQGLPPADDDWLDRAFAALADRTRRAILARLAEGDASVTELAAPFAMSQPAVSKHLAVLESAGLVSRRKEGRTRPCRLEAAPLRSLAEWVGGYELYWADSFDRLDEVLADLDDGTAGSPRQTTPRTRGATP